MHSASHIVNHNNVNLADLQKQILELKEIVSSHVLLSTCEVHENGNVTFMTFSPFGTVIERKWIFLLNKLTHFTQQ